MGERGRYSVANRARLDFLSVNSPFGNAACTLVVNRAHFLFFFTGTESQRENMVFVLGSYDHFLSVSPLSPSFVTMSSSEPIGVGRK